MKVAESSKAATTEAFEKAVGVWRPPATGQKKAARRQPNLLEGEADSHAADISTDIETTRELSMKTKNESTLTAERLREVLDYDPLTGLFIRKGGTVAGSTHHCGYIQIYVDKKYYLAHRLAWFYVHGQWPKTHDLDHINGIKTDNRITNLREASRSQNRVNCKVRGDCKSGVKGVSWNKWTNAWQAVIYWGKKRYYLGSFAEIDGARMAYEGAAQLLHGAFAHHVSQQQKGGAAS